MTYTTTSMTMEQVAEMIRNERAMQEGTLRDRFAMAALTGVCVEYYNPDEDNLTVDEWDHATIAKGCYMMADAMLKAREEEK